MRRTNNNENKDCKFTYRGNGGGDYLRLSYNTRLNESANYPALLRVIDIQNFNESGGNGYVLTLRNNNGFLYTLCTESGDYNLGEYYACIMNDNGTAAISDDTIEKMHYVRMEDM